MVDVALRAAGELDGEASRRGARPAHRVAARRRRDPRLARAHLARSACCRRRARSLGAAGEVLSLVAREGFELLDAPPLLVAAPDSPVPFAPELEDAYIPSRRARRRGAAEARWLLTRTGEALALRGRGRASRATTALRALPAHAAAPPDRGARRPALPPGTRLRLGLHRPRPGGRGAPPPATRSAPTTCARRSTASSPATSPAASRAAQAFRNFLGKGDSPTRGRDGNMHFGVPERGVFPLVSMLGDLCPVTVGAALAFKRRREPRVALTFWGDGAMSTGDVHEGLNLAAVLEGAGRVRAAVQRLRLLDADRAGRWSTPAWPTASRAAGASPPRASTAATRSRRSSPCAPRSRRRAPAAGPRAVEAVTLRLDGHAAHDDGSYMDQAQLSDYVDAARPDRAAGRAPCGSTVSPTTRSRPCARAAADEVSAGLAGGRSLAGARPGDAAGRRLRDEADVSDAGRDRRARARASCARS